MRVQFRQFGGDTVARVTRRWFKFTETFVRSENDYRASWISDSTGTIHLAMPDGHYSGDCVGRALGRAIEARYRAHLRDQLEELAVDIGIVPTHTIKK